MREGDIKDVRTKKGDNTANIIKKTAKMLGMNYRELGDAIGYTEGGIKNAVAQNKISKSMQKAIELYLENVELKQAIEESEKLKRLINDFLSK